MASAPRGPRGNGFVFANRRRGERICLCAAAIRKNKAELTARRRSTLYAFKHETVKRPKTKADLKIHISRGSVCNCEATPGHTCNVPQGERICLCETATGERICLCAVAIKRNKAELTARRRSTLYAFNHETVKTPKPSPIWRSIFRAVPFVTARPRQATLAMCPRGNGFVFAKRRRGERICLCAVAIE